VTTSTPARRELLPLERNKDGRAYTAGLYRMQRQRAARRPGPLPLALNLGTPKAANAEPVKLQGLLVQCNTTGQIK